MKAKEIILILIQCLLQFVICLNVIFVISIIIEDPNLILVIVYFMISNLLLWKEYDRYHTYEVKMNEM
jgi:hypothetical protein